jgi:uncharacterized membrane protein
MEQKNVLMGILAYLGPLVIVSYIVAREDPFVKFHIKQGLVLFVIEVGLWILSGFFWMLFYQFWMIWQIVNIALFILAILGIVNAVQGNEKELPLVGSFAKNFNI